MPIPQESSLSALIEAAFREGAAKLLLRARQTGSPLIVWKDGRVQAISAEEAAAEIDIDSATTSPPGGNGSTPPETP